MKNKKLIAAFVTVSIILSAGVITLGVLLGQSYDKNDTVKAQLAGHYQQAYYTLLDETNDMEIKLSKTIVAEGLKPQEENLRDVIKSAEVSANALSALSAADVSVEDTMKFINQTGDFSAFLVDKLEDEVSLTEEQKNSLVKIRDMMARLGHELDAAKDDISDGNLFVENVNTTLSNIFTDLNNASVEYPQLIYDGPFSDALNDKETKGLTGDDIDEAKGREIITAAFGGSLTDLSYVGEWSADIPSLNFEGKVNGYSTTLQLAKKGGMILSVNSYRDVTNPTLSVTECSEKGKAFLEKLGYENMQAVWTCNDNSTVFVNYAPVVNGVIIYPDLVKLKISADDGDVFGLEARNYAFNHTERTLLSPAYSADAVKVKLPSLTDATGGTLCLIPYKTNAEKLAYEFILQDRGTYYIYVDAQTGEEINIMYVVSTTGGDKLI